MMHAHAEWSNAVRVRDGCCVRCGSTKFLHAHHIKPKAEYPELRYDIANGATLCHSCHMAEHQTNPVRTKTGRTQRRTLEAQIAALTAEVAELKAEISRLTSVQKPPRAVTVAVAAECRNPGLAETSREWFQRWPSH